MGCDAIQVLSDPRSRSPKLLWKALILGRRRSRARAVRAALPDLREPRRMANQGASTVRYGTMTRKIRDVLGEPESWPNFRHGGVRLPLLRGATILAAREAEPDEVRMVVDARGQILHSTFVIADRDVRHRVLEVLQPGMLLEAGLDHLL